MKNLPLSTKVAHLRRASSYAGNTAQIDAIETHMSWLFLTDRFVYKLKKPIHYDRLDFSTLKLRHYYCEEEVRLNRRLAETVYLDTVVLTQEVDGTLALNGTGLPVDWLVKMRRLPAHLMLDWVLAHRFVEPDDVRAVAQRLAEFFISADPVSIAPVDFCTRLEAGIQSDRRELIRPEYGLKRELVEQIASHQLAFLNKHTELFEERINEGHIIEGHGDLRPEHICLKPESVIIDCLEFCQELREVDPADELAFLMLECERLGQPKVGDLFLEAYEKRAGDPLPRPLLDFYRKYRILRRAKIAAWHLNEPLSRDRERYATRARRYLELAD